MDDSQAAEFRPPGPRAKATREVLHSGKLQGHLHRWSCVCPRGGWTCHLWPLVMCVPVHGGLTVYDPWSCVSSHESPTVCTWSRLENLKQQDACLSPHCHLMATGTAAQGRQRLLSLFPRSRLDRKQKRGAGMALLIWPWNEIKLSSGRQGGSDAPT